jgi:hypothetical protein
MDPPDESGATRERFHTSWESAPNRNRNFTILPVSTLEGWRTVDEPDGGCGGQDAFIIWSSGDRMKDGCNSSVTVYAAPGDGKNWLEIGDAEGHGHQTYGIERDVRTRDGRDLHLYFRLRGPAGLHRRLHEPRVLCRRGARWQLRQHEPEHRAQLAAGRLPVHG